MCPNVTGVSIAPVASRPSDKKESKDDTDDDSERSQMDRTVAMRADRGKLLQFYHARLNSQDDLSCRVKKAADKRRAAATR